ncbi:MAG: ABC transporter ATP-binding protein [Rhodospirillales bacterium]|nr:ABC transporter ATP-binding protein [Rhodospirillales bacterium]
MSILAHDQDAAEEPAVAENTPLLNVSGLSAYYGELRALFDLDFQVKKGEVLSIIGANGAGKSTLLKSIVGLINRGKTAHFDGQIHFAGRRLDKLVAEEIIDAGVALVPEGRMLFQRMSVEDNLRVGAYLPKCRASEADKLEEMFIFFPRLKERKDQVVSNMSGGEQQMVAIARALMSCPDLIMFDELSLGLSPLIVDDIYQKVSQINEAGITCIVIEQDMKRALDVSDRVLVMLEGRVVLKGRPQELSEDEVAAAYFGSHYQGSQA